MSLVVLLFFLLVAMPPALMAIAHIYAVFAQDVKEHYVVVLREGSPSQFVALEHVRDYGVVLDRVWDSSIKGYSGYVPLRKLAQIEADSRVVRTERREDDEFLKR